ncbi:MAG: hypothetical protein WAN22_29160 [Solirubrobacteraceae bacterium]
MHCASWSGEPPLATPVLDLADVPHAATANAKLAAAIATLRLYRSAFTSVVGVG